VGKLDDPSSTGKNQSTKPRILAWPLAMRSRVAAQFGVSIARECW